MKTGSKDTAFQLATQCRYIFRTRLGIAILRNLPPLLWQSAHLRCIIAHYVFCAGDHLTSRVSTCRATETVTGVDNYRLAENNAAHERTHRPVVNQNNYRTVATIAFFDQPNSHAADAANRSSITYLTCLFRYLQRYINFISPLQWLASLGFCRFYVNFYT